MKLFAFDNKTIFLTKINRVLIKKFVSSNCKTGKKGNDKARSYYPSFTRDNLRLMFYHLTATFLFYMMIFPMVNFVFTYCTNTDIKVLLVVFFIFEFTYSFFHEKYFALQI